MRLSADVIKVLDASTIEGNSLALPTKWQGKEQRLPATLYRAVNQALEALGGKWSRKTQTHLFDEDPAGAIADAIAMGSVKVEDRKKALQFFETPASVAFRLMQMADLKSGQRILEPSAGKGAIIDQLPWRTLGCSMHAVEIDERNWVALVGLGFARNVYKGDFLAYEPAEGFDRIVANPPFSRQQDIDHVLHMHKLLNPGGLLVSVMASNVTFRENRKTVEFREFVTRNGGSIEPLPDGSFKASGTGVSTCVAKIPKAA